MFLISAGYKILLYLVVQFSVKLQQKNKSSQAVVFRIEHDVTIKTFSYLFVVLYPISFLLNEIGNVTHSLLYTNKDS